MSPERSEPAGLHGLRKQVTEAKQDEPLELRIQAKKTHLGGGGEGRQGLLQRDRVPVSEHCGRKGVGKITSLFKRDKKCSPTFLNRHSIIKV